MTDQPTDGQSTNPSGGKAGDRGGSTKTTLPFAVSLPVGSSLANETGSWRTERPVYVDLLPPCNKACPAGENIQLWLSHAEDGRYEDAWREIMRNNPLPAVMGRVCYHSCQTACNRAEVDEAVGINAIERFLGDKAIEEGWAPTVAVAPSGKKVLVVGSGPSGLSAAYHLALGGHAVTVRDLGDEPGGMMRYGIPSYRLPRNILDAEINRIRDLGVTFEQGVRVDDLDAALEEFDAVFTAVGAGLARNIGVPAGEAAHVLDAVDVLRDVEKQQTPLLGRRVVVYGGGNTAIDAARTARRLGAEESVIVYRRTRGQMPAHESEVMEAEEEGITMRWLSTVGHVDEGAITIEKMVLDDDGFPQPTGEYEQLAADSVIMALGQESDLTLFDGVDGIVVERGVVAVDDRMMTGRPGVFAGGDMVPSDKNVTVAIGHGKKAARHIDAWLSGTDHRPPAKHGDATLDRMETWYYSDAPHQVRAKLEGARRASTFDEVVQGLDEDSALFEARRCMSCGNCFGCDNCFGVCPDNAVIKFEPGRYEFKYDYCKGCGVCAEECPCGAISMVPEEI
ncbi:NAD(P)-binding protein [Corynebacterium freneyi]|uniref:NAD(P)-binding protein n=1 Tax=Corynebacterium freneyi TaxID=134034 RepID=UPI001CCE46E6|nr:NAD(P)-binding protein [Corynebacterium freneyi]UBI02991.1 NAD(P)-binding protein [Corynebacterium freneyi]